MKPPQPSSSIPHSEPSSGQLRGTHWHIPSALQTWFAGQPQPSTFPPQPSSSPSPQRPFVGHDGSRHVPEPSSSSMQHSPVSQPHDRTWPQTTTWGPQTPVGHRGVSLPQHVLAKHVSPSPQPPQSMVPPHPSGITPQLSAGHTVRGEQHTLPAVQRSPEPQAHVISAPAPLGKVPHSRPPPVNSSQVSGS